MKKKTIICVLLAIITMFFSVSNVDAQELNNTLINTGNLVQIADCSGQNAILGNVNDPNSVAWLLQKLLDYSRIIGPFLVLILSSLDYVKALISSDDDSIKKSNQKLITRLVLIIALFLLPTLVSFLLNILGFTSHEVCGLQ